MLMKEDDIYIATFIDLFNLRFAPSQKPQARQAQAGHPPPRQWDSQAPHDADPGDWPFGGIAEMAHLQREFRIFRSGRPFWQSAALLGVGGHTNARAKNRWLALLMWLGTCTSDKPNENGDQRIVNALVANLARPDPLPCYMTAHEMDDPQRGQVIVKENDRPLFYIEQDFLTISLPMQSWDKARRARRPRGTGGGQAGAAARPSARRKQPVRKKGA
jgi:hypothetical protein